MRTWSVSNGLCPISLMPDCSSSQLPPLLTGILLPPGPSSENFDSPLRNTVVGVGHGCSVDGGSVVRRLPTTAAAVAATAAAPAAPTAAIAPELIGADRIGRGGRWAVCSASMMPTTAS